MQPGTVPRRSPPRRHRGFTAVEMLVVMFIIAILAAFLVVAVIGVRHRAQVTGTEAVIEKIEQACDRYFKVWGHYPPATFADLGYLRHLDANPDPTQRLPHPPPPGHDTDFEGIEALLMALTDPQLGGPFIEVQGGRDLCDIDEDAGKDVTGRPVDDARFSYWELADAWGFPLRYENLGDDVGVQIESAGKDGLFGTDDDLSNR